MTHTMIACTDLNHAVALRDAGAETPMYSSYENVREEHLRFFKAYPKMAVQWLFEPSSNEVFHISHLPDGQRLLNKHGLVDTLSGGSLNYVIGGPSEDDSETWRFEKLEIGVSKGHKEVRKAWCKLGRENFLTGDL